MSEPSMRPTGRPQYASWLICRRRRPEAVGRLYCFPHTGGSPGEFLRWSDDLSVAEIWGVQSPGRGARLGEPPLSSMSDWVDCLLDEAVFEEPFAFFGHSLGALAAFETTRALRERGRSQPHFITISACAPPHDPRDTACLRNLPAEELLAALDRYGGQSANPLTDPTLRELVMPAYRADVTMSETYRYLPGPPLETPLYVVGGDDDMPKPLLMEWAWYTTGPFHIRMLPGGHFYLRDMTCQQQLVRLLIEAMTLWEDIAHFDPSAIPQTPSSLSRNALPPCG